MGDELIDVVDEENNLLKIQKMKSEAHAKGLWHRAAHVWIYNSEGKVMLQFRAKNKLLFPAVWDISVGGHVAAGEEALVSAMRETEEELGIKANVSDFDFIRIMKIAIKYKDIDNKEFIYVYLLKFDGNIDELSVQEEEVEKIRFFSFAEVSSLVDKGIKYIITNKNYWQEMSKIIKERLQ